MKQLRQMRITAVNRHQWMAGALLALFLGVFVLTLSETLHREVHADACESEHQCAVTMLRSGQIDTPVAAVPPIIGSVLFYVAAPILNDFVPAVDSFLPPSCGPPALLS
jgi:hypothetical protein